MTLLFYFYFILVSIIGYGLFFSNFLKIRNKNLGYLGFIGLFFLIFYSSINSFIVKHNELHNSIFLLLGFLSFVYFCHKKKFYQNNQLIKLFAIFVILIPFILISKNHDDFYYYHFQYSLILTEYNHPIGIGNFNHGFRTPSSIFYISSLFYLPIVKFYLFHLAPAYFVGFANLVLIEKLFDKNIFTKTRFISYLSLFGLILINILFYRLAEHGTDRSAQIIIFIIFVEILFLINFKDKIVNQNDKIKIITILIFICITLKAFFVIYLFLIAPLFYLMKKKLLKINSMIINRVNIICIFLGLTYAFINILNTGCFLYPLYFTCVENLSWSIPIDEVKRMSLHYENWAKAGSGANYKNNLDHSLYISNFNWFLNWVDKYFFNKVSDFLLTILFISTLIFIFYKSEKKNKNLKKKSIWLLYFFLIGYFLEWFTKHPSLRYGGYHIIYLLFFIPFSIYLEKISINFKLFVKKTKIILLIIFVIFFARNFDRIIDEKKKYQYDIVKSLNYRTNVDMFKMKNMIDNLNETLTKCDYKNEICKKDDVIISKIFNNKLYYKIN